MACHSPRLLTTADEAIARLRSLHRSETALTQSAITSAVQSAAYGYTGSRKAPAAPATIVATFLIFFHHLLFFAQR
jgi:hypothetical protein